MIACLSQYLIFMILLDYLHDLKPMVYFPHRAKNIGFLLLQDI